MRDSRKHLFISVLVFALAAGFLAWAYTYEPKERLVPVLVGWIALVLTAVDVLAHTDNPVGRLVAMALSGTAHRDADEATGAVRLEVSAAIWMVVALGLILLVGFMVAVPVYVFVYMLVQGRKPVVQSGLTALVTTVFIWVVFETLLKYEVYRGLLFED